MEQRKKRDDGGRRLRFKGRGGKLQHASVFASSARQVVARPRARNAATATADADEQREREKRGTASGYCSCLTGHLLPFSPDFV